MDLKHFVVLALQGSVSCTAFGFGRKTTTDNQRTWFGGPAFHCARLSPFQDINPVFLDRSRNMN